MRAEYKNRGYTVVPYDLHWVDAFEQLATRLKAIWSYDALAIEHIGSTSVPEMEGKPTIDALVLVDDINKADSHVGQMEQEGFEYAGEFVMAGSRLFRIIEGDTVKMNVHVFPTGHPHAQEMLRLRDYLRTHPEEILGYSQMKAGLYGKYKNDYGQYRKEKDEYMKGLKRRMRTD